ncbi:MAG: CDGSH iron-sulfur domain-containing protein [Alphaproteobacteria bacterium]|nr:CDGSH iron-sulfur domain-containing protein [Alphaproteobacteria bacterium]
MTEPEIVVQDREELAELLTEAVEVEHNLMCCYLFAAWSLKSGTHEGLTDEQAQAVARWRAALVHVAIDEMTHFALANNLLVAIGGRPHLGRPNFPVSPGYHPAGVVVELRRFERSTIDHFVFLERPEGVELPDGAGFEAPRYERGVTPDLLMPTAQDYGTVGHLYRGIQAGFRHLAAVLGEDALFVGDPACQIDERVVQLDGLIGVRDLASALQAIDNIVEQGEGNVDNPESSHFRRFSAVRDEYAALLGADAEFEPSRPVVRSPVQRKPPTPAGKTWVGEPRAAGVLDLANALYNHMLRMLGVAWSPVPAGVRAALVDEAIALMQALVPVNEVLTRMPPQAERPDVAAGMSFAVTREIRVPEPVAAGVLIERTRRLADGAARLAAVDPVLTRISGQLAQMADRLDRAGLGRIAVHGASAVAAAPAPVAAAPRVEGDLEYSADPSIPPRRMVDGVEVIEGEHLTLRFDGKRCIHARFCVLGAPEVFVGNVQGPWIRPDAIDAEALAGIAHRCPSGAITYTRKDGRPDEAPPSVNTLYVRQDGPYAVNADLRIEGEAPRLRATLCRCGASKRKPYCDGSHHDIGFTATGEPATGDVTALEVRSGVLEVRPAKDGPLMVSGNLELCSGTGRTFAKKQKCALCRCGGSQNKPFCDGTHRTNGFRSE